MTEDLSLNPGAYQGACLVNARGGSGGLQFVGYVVGCHSSGHVDPMALSMHEGA